VAVTAPPRTPPAVAAFSHRQLSSARQSMGNEKKTISRISPKLRMQSTLQHRFL
jgi:hypothetical protein